jgi:hypothetical protein
MRWTKKGKVLFNSFWCYFRLLRTTAAAAITTMSMTAAATMYRVIGGAVLLGGVAGVGEIAGEGEVVGDGEAVGEGKDEEGKDGEGICVAAADDTIMEVTALELK